MAGQSPGNGLCGPEDGLAQAAPVLHSMGDAERAGLLDELLTARPDLTATVEALARAHLEKADADEIAVEVASTVDELVWEDIGARSGYQSGRGYVEPTEAAWELLTEALRPFTDDIARRAHHGFRQAATDVAVGVVTGLYDCRDARDGTVLAEAGGEEAARELASEAIAVLNAVGLGPAPETPGQRWPDWSPALA